MAVHDGLDELQKLRSLVGIVELFEVSRPTVYRVLERANTTIAL